ncbi:polymorphic toxin-type HINT domain-containing protein [Streptomyces kasugaensis]|uniref:polymorphic toxin-type HINT domain-containing protein n=1 Tax=Streptomyces kasugaensis TaxID=1946 RepID=UPI0013EF85E5|nr:polymorphic toxin-type HINT domain-containing protein [Streptomyces kasugaensis]
MSRFGMRGLAGSVAIAAMMGLLPGQAVSAVPENPGSALAAGRPARLQPPTVPVKPLATGGNKHSGTSPAPSWQAPKVRWPAAGSTEVALDPADSEVTNSLSSQGASGRRADTLPITVTPARPTARSAAADPTKVKVTLADHGAARKAGIDGLLLSMTRTDIPASKGKPVPVRIQVDYSSFRGAYGGDWASRLRLIQLPGCAVRTPEKAECRVQKPLPTENDTRSGKLSTASVTLATPDAGAGTARAAVAPTVLGATADSSGSSGDYKATNLKASGAWSQGGASGSFNWSYPVGVPGVPGGLQPSVSLSYSSRSVDGLTAASNNQPSWIGDGWSWEPGFIERRYKPCNNDKEGSTNTTKVGDLCWFNDNATMSLGGKSTELVYDKDKKEWHPADDDGERVEKLTDGHNGDDNGEHWKITTADGTQYFFGLNRLPGWKDSSTPETNSTWTVPVFGNHPGEPCYQASFASAWCQQAWRWQLDYVVDRHGNAMAYHWKTESNNYGRNVSETTGKATATPYIRGGWLDHIDYGLRSDDSYTGKAMGRVAFDVKERCLTNCGTFNEDNAKYWPDVPYDLECKDGTECKDRYSPSFWSRKRLSGITTKVLTGGSYKDVDSWTLEQDFPPAGDGISTPMWLKSITRTGKTAGSETLPSVTFEPVQRDNRVDKLGDGLAPFVRLRLSRINTETGGATSVNYSDVGCTAATLPAPDATNTTRCYPVKWAYEGETAKQDWFNSYVVTQVSESGGVKNSPETTTAYSYLDGAAWTKSTDELTKAEDRTYSVARGYSRVQVRTGAHTDPRTLSETRYFRGVDGKAVKDSAGESVTDREQFAGLVREKASFNGDGGPLLAAASYIPWLSAPTASRTRNGLPDLEAHHVGTQSERTRTTTSTGERKTSLTRAFDAYGMVASVSDLGDSDKTGDEMCTTTTYVRNTNAWLLNLVSRTETVSVPCDAAATRPQDTISDTRTYYDGATSLTAAPSLGDVSRTEQINGKGDGYDTTASTPTTCGTAKKQLCYDIYGRALAVSDTYGKTTTTTYTPDTDEVPAKTVVTNPLGHQTTTTLEPLRGLPAETTDANSRVTTNSYDALGRLTMVWTPARPASANPDSPSYQYSYQVRTDGPVIVTTKALNHNSLYQVSYAFFDGLLRPFQTQAPAPDDSGRLVTETFYDSRGQAWRDSGTYYADGKAEPSAVTGQETFYPASADTEFDGAGRPKAVISRKFGDETKRTTTTYTGDTTTVVPPKGATATTTVADARGRLVEVKQYTDSDRTTWNSTGYTYDSLGRLAEVTDPAKATWKYRYDARGRTIHADDPDKGATDTTYDKGDRVTDVKDARGITLHTDYDGLGRRTALTQGTTKLAEWTYDTATGGKGQPASSTRYVDGAAYVSRTTAYSTLYKPSITEVTIPAEEGGLAGTYKWSTAYYQTGLLKWVRQPAVGGLPQEDVSPGYTANSGLPRTLTAGSDPLVSDTKFDHYGRVQIAEYGEFAKHLNSSYTYDDHTGELVRSFNDRDTAPQRIDDTRYTYDPAGNTTAIATSYGQDAARVSDNQCFTTDALRRITEAWTSTTDACPAAPSATTVGGPDAYWTSYTYDAAGNRKIETQHKTASGPAGDVTRTYAPPAVGKHNLPAITRTGPTGTAEESYQYDPTGNTTLRALGTGDAQKLSWDAEGHLDSTAQGPATTKYTYDADGNRLLRKDSSGTTLYLPEGNELHLPKTGIAVGTRYYNSGDKPVAVRTGGNLTYLLADPHNTVTTQIDAANQAITRRKTTIFGAPRGPEPTAWTGDKGFVGGTDDADTGLSHLGAREYDPATARFISVDPLMDLTDPQQVHGYTYANNNPLAFTDPDGLMLLGEDGLGHGLKHKTGGGMELVEEERASKPWTNGSNAPRKDSGHRGSSRPKSGGNQDSGECGFFDIKCGVKDLFKSGCDFWDAKCSLKENAAAWGAVFLPDADAWKGCAEDFGFNANCGSAATDLPWGKYLKLLKLGKREVKGVEALSHCKCFLAGTGVLMSDGATKNIEDIKIGDKVQATDPETGASGTRKVTRRIVTDDDKQFNKLSIATAEGIETLTATHEHPFWSPSEHRWTEARSLQPGMTLLTNDGDTVIVAKNQPFAKHARTYNLTVEGLHTYYVLAGATPVLVHNSGGCPDLDALSQSGMRAAKGNTTHAGREYQKHMNRGDLPVVSGKQLKSAGQDLLDDILTNPKTATSAVNSGNFAGGSRYIMPDPAGGRGIGATFDANGQFQYFGRY